MRIVAVIRSVVISILLIAFFSSQAAAQTTLNLSRDLVSLGIASSNMIPDQPSQDAGPLFQSGVAYASAHSIGRVIADTGAYYFLSVNSNTHVEIGGLSNMTIDMQGSDVIFTHPLFSVIYRLVEV